jgi:hypothetical protein
MTEHADPEAIDPLCPHGPADRRRRLAGFTVSDNGRRGVLYERDGPIEGWLSAARDVFVEVQR